VTGATALLYDWMAASSIVGDTGLVNGPQLGVPIVTAANSPFASGSTPTYTGLIVDPYGNGIPAAAFSGLTLSIVDTLSGDVINDASQVNILNTGRGTIDAEGNLTIALETGDTTMDEAPGAAQIQRSLIIDWQYATSGPQATTGTGRHQANFILTALAGP
jgi:hypothetical protein